VSQAHIVVENPTDLGHQVLGGGATNTIVSGGGTATTRIVHGESNPIVTDGGTTTTRIVPHMGGDTIVTGTTHTGTTGATIISGNSDKRILDLKHEKGGAPHDTAADADMLFQEPQQLYYDETSGELFYYEDQANTDPQAEYYMSYEDLLAAGLDADTNLVMYDDSALQYTDAGFLA